MVATLLIGTSTRCWAAASRI